MSTRTNIFFVPWRKSPQWAKASSLLRIDDHAQLDTPHSAGLLWTSDQPGADTSTWQHTTLTRDRQTSMPPAGFESTFPASERLQKARPLGSTIRINWLPEKSEYWSFHNSSLHKLHEQMCQSLNAGFGSRIVNKLNSAQQNTRRHVGCLHCSHQLTCQRLTSCYQKN